MFLWEVRRDDAPLFFISGRLTQEIYAIVQLSVEGIVDF